MWSGYSSSQPYLPMTGTVCPRSATAAAVRGRDRALQDRWAVASDATGVRRLCDRPRPPPAVEARRRLRGPVGGPDLAGREAGRRGTVPGRRRLHHRECSPRRCCDAPGRVHHHRPGNGHRSEEKARQGKEGPPRRTRRTRRTSRKEMGGRGAGVRSPATPSCSRSATPRKDASAGSRAGGTGHALRQEVRQLHGGA